MCVRHTKKKKERVGLIMYAGLSRGSTESFGIKIATACVVDALYLPLRSPVDDDFI